MIPLSSRGSQVDRTIEVDLPSGRTFELPVLAVVLPASAAAAPATWSRSYQRKRLVDVGHGPEFAELGVCSVMRDEGWGAAWLDTFQRRVVGGLDFGEPVERVAFQPADLPVEIESRLDDISERLTPPDGPRLSRWSGRFDVVAWRGADLTFLECKAAGTSDRFRESQIRWLDAALSCGVPSNAFWLVEWRAA